jgi:hypothetical protein
MDNITVFNSKEQRKARYLALERMMLDNWDWVIKKQYHLLKRLVSLILARIESVKYHVA